MTTTTTISKAMWAPPLPAAISTITTRPTTTTTTFINIITSTMLRHPPPPPRWRPPQTATAVSAPPRPKKKKKHRSLATRTRRSWRRVAAKLANMDPIKLAYLRTSFVFAISVLVTWTPSSINRVYTLIHPEAVSYALNVASAAVLPLQGVWNAVIYTLPRAPRSCVPSTPNGRAAWPQSPGGTPALAVPPAAPAPFGWAAWARADRFERGTTGRCRRADSDEMEMGNRVNTRAIVRVQKGCELDA